MEKPEIMREHPVGTGYDCQDAGFVLAATLGRGGLGLYLVFRMSDVVSRPGGAGELGLIGFVLNNVRCSLFVVL